MAVNFLKRHERASSVNAAADPTEFELDVASDDGTSQATAAPTIPPNNPNLFERYVDSQPILNMLDLLTKTGRENFHKNGAWEICLCALILSLEPSCKIHRILEALPYEQTEMDEASFLNTMAHLGYFCRKAESDLNDIDVRLLPAIFIPASGKPSVLIGRDKESNLLFFDPIAKIVSVTPPSLAEDGTIWFFQRYDENRRSISKFMRQGSGHSWFRALLNRFRGTFVQIMAAGFVLNVIALTTPLYIMMVYDRVIAAAAPDVLFMLAVGVFAAIGFEYKLRKIRSEGLSWLSGRLDNVVGNKIFAHLIGLSPNMIERASVSAQIARIKTFESVRDFFSSSIFMALLEIPFVVIAVLAIYFIAGNLVLIPIAFAALYTVLFYGMRARIKTVIRLAAKTSSARQQFTIETFEKLEGIRANGLHKKWQEKYRHLSGRKLMTHFQLAWLGIVSETIANALTIMAAVSTIGFGVHMVWEGAISSGALVATMILVWRILTPFYSLCTVIPRLEQLRNSIIQINDLMDIETEAEQARSFSRLSKLKGGVSFHHVDFKYNESGDEAFSDLSFEARPGELIAITGSNGTGKATILKLIKSMYHATGGVIRIDGFDIRQIDGPDLRRQIAYIPKTPSFFSGSIIENLRLSNPLASEADITAALKQADVWDEICALPDGWHTKIGMQFKSLLTSSLATKLSIARAYISPAAILLIDELPNTILSGKCGDNLKAYLARCKGRKTVLLCTYRNDFLQLADGIVWLRGLDAPLFGERNSILSKLSQTQKGLSA
jgi:ABC-type bacteriocin/lantibiotic exporter with double-glycine peptidase domain